MQMLEETSEVTKTILQLKNVCRVAVFFLSFFDSLLQYRVEPESIQKSNDLRSISFRLKIRFFLQENSLQLKVACLLALCSETIN